MQNSCHFYTVFHLASSKPLACWKQSQALAVSVQLKFFCQPKAWLLTLIFLLSACIIFLWQCLAKTLQQHPWQCNWTSLSDRNYSLFNRGLWMLSLKQAGCLVSQSEMLVHRISPGTISSYSWFAVKLQDWSEWDSPGVCPGFGNTHCFHYWNDWWSRDSSY